MTIPGRLLLGMMIISILSYGFSASAFADFHGCGPNEILNVEGVCVSAFDADEPGPQAFTVKTDQPSYNDRDTIKISGNVGTLNTNYDVAVTLMLLDPEENIVSINQLLADSSGGFSKAITAGGPLWKLTGDYEIRAQYGTQKSSITFSFTAPGVLPEPPKPIECPPDESARS